MDTQGGFYISQIKQLQDRIFKKLVKDIGLELNGAQGRILFVLWREDNLSISEIGKRTSLANTTLTGMIDRMVDKGMLKRSVNENNRRQLIVSLTPQSAAMKKAYEEVSQKMNAIFYKGFSQKQVELFERKLERVLQNLTEQGENEYEKDVRDC